MEKIIFITIFSVLSLLFFTMIERTGKKSKKSGKGPTPPQKAETSQIATPVGQPNFGGFSPFMMNGQDPYRKLIEDHFMLQYKTRWMRLKIKFTNFLWVLVVLFLIYIILSQTNL